MLPPLERNIEDVYMWVEHISFPTPLFNELKRINTLWLHDPNLREVTSIIPALQSQLQLGWSHLFFGHTHVSMAEYLHDYYQTRNRQRNAQTVLSQFIYKLWTIVIRPQWQHRNKLVHAQDATVTTTRIQQNLWEEVSERFESTNYEIFAYDDRKLFDTTLDSLLEKPTSHLYAWWESVDIAVRSSSTMTLYCNYILF